MKTKFIFSWFHIECKSVNITISRLVSSFMFIVNVGAPISYFKEGLIIDFFGGKISQNTVPYLSRVPYFVRRKTAALASRSHS